MEYAAERINRIIDAPVVRVRQLFKNTHPRLDLSQGIPFFSPSEDMVKDLFSKGQKENFNIYSPDQGRESFRNLLCEHLSNYNINSTPEEIVVTPGANQAAFMIFCLLFSPGDEIILFKPYYFNHFMSLKILGLNPLIVDTDENLKIDPEKLSNKITPRTKALVVVSPNNPSGSMVDKSTVFDLIEIADKFGLYIISDEAYHDFCWDKSHFSPLTTNYPKVIGIWSFSKSYGISGWRLGWMKLPPSLVGNILKIADCTHICTPVISQLLGEKLITDDPKMPERFGGEILTNRNLLLNMFKDRELEKKITVYPSWGGFYIFLGLKPSSNLQGWEVVEQLAKKHKIAVMPGEPFGMTGTPFIRISYGNLKHYVLQQNLNRLKQGLVNI
ncbi:MAG: aminotransferase class I/II-fold pyridoxal phosphate-dependent enzyme [bacterium]